METHSCIKRLPSQHTLLALPEELLYEVLGLLDYKSLLVIRLTCKQLRTIVRTHLVGTYKSFESLLRSDAPIFEGPAGGYSAEELERKVLKRLKIQEKWRNPNPSTFRRRKINLDFDRCSHFRLLPGGRWLFCNTNGYVYVLDLDNSTPMPQALFEEVRYNNHGHYIDPLNGFAIWADLSKSWLSLRMALHNNTEHHDSSRICIYQLDFREQGAGGVWEVKPIITLLCPGPCTKSRLRLGGDNVVERCRYKRDSVSTWKFHIFRYTEPGPRLLVWEYQTAANVIPLPGNRLVAITDSEPSAEIFNINISPDSQSLTLESSFRLPLHSTSTLWASKLYSDRHYAYIVTTCKDSIDVLQVPHEASAQPRVRRFPLDAIQDYVQVSGLSLLLILHTNHFMDVITFDLWGDQCLIESHASVLMATGYAFLDLLACDEGSGRVIMQSGRVTFLLEI